jgi:hypothetical protein
MTDKTCKGCGQLKAIDQFPKNGKLPNGGQRLSNRCAPCKKIYDVGKYYEHRTKILERKSWSKRTIRPEHQKLVWQYLKDNPCLRCGETDPVVLEFDHREPQFKYKDISKMIGHNSTEKLLEEIAKCDVLCANCHRRRTAKQQGWAILNLE